MLITSPRVTYCDCCLSSPQEKCLQETEKRLKEVSETAGKAQRGHTTLVGQVDKYRSLSETLKHKSEGLEAQLVATRKVPLVY